MGGRNPFGDEVPAGPERVNPFGEEPDSGSAQDAAARLEQAARSIRELRTQMGAEGLTLSGTRSLIQELSAALDAAARGLRALEREREG